jgi:hypothetical protein
MCQNNKIKAQLLRDLSIVKFIRARKLYCQQLASFLPDTDNEFADFLVYTEIG